MDARAVTDDTRVRGHPGDPQQPPRSPSICKRRASCEQGPGADRRTVHNKYHQRLAVKVTLTTPPVHSSQKRQSVQGMPPSQQAYVTWDLTVQRTPRRR